jgi:hypothetical protein
MKKEQELLLLFMFAVIAIVLNIALGLFPSLVLDLHIIPHNIQTHQEKF